MGGTDTGSGPPWIVAAAKGTPFAPSAMLQGRPTRPMPLSSRSAFAQSFTLGGGDDMFQISCMETRMTIAIASKAANMFVTNQFTSPRVHQHTTSHISEGGSQTADGIKEVG